MFPFHAPLAANGVTNFMDGAGRSLPYGCRRRALIQKCMNPVEPSDTIPARPLSDPIVMCTLALLRRPKHPWPVIIGANRDELASRRWQEPGRHWTDRPGVIGGIDLEQGGTWLAVNDANVLAVLLNRPTPEPPASGLRTRGELPLLALDHTSASAAATAVMRIDSRQWRPFNLVIADRSEAFWIRSDTCLTRHPIPAGLSLLANGDMNAATPARINVYRQPFERAPSPDPDCGNWEAWAQLLGHRPTGSVAPAAGMVVPFDHRGFGTTSSTLLAIPANPDIRPAWKFAPGPPDQTPFRPVRTGTIGGGRPANALTP